jgi:hypothetical protein
MFSNIILSQCDQIGHTLPLLVPANEAQARPLTVLDPEQQLPIGVEK